MKYKNYFPDILLPFRPITFFISLLLLCGDKCYSQGALQQGSILPAITIRNILHYTKDQINTSDLKDELLILDFMNTYCGNCIDALPRLDSLQKKFSGRIQILLVCNEPVVRVKRFIEHNQTMAGVNLPVAAADSLLNKLFPHAYVPHEVWIYKGVIRDITDADYITERNVRSILNGRENDWTQKTDLQGFDYNAPLIKEAKTNSVDLNIGATHTAIMGHINGAATRLVSGRDSITGQPFVRFINYNLLGLYLYSFDDANQVPFSHVLIRSAHAKDYVYRDNAVYREDWNRQHTYCYERTFPAGLSDAISRQAIINDLNINFGVKAEIRDTLMDCIEIYSRSGTSDKRSEPAHYDQGSLNFLNSSALLTRLNHDHIGLPFFSAVTNESIFPINLPIGTMTNIDRLATYLKSLGLAIRHIKKQCRMLILTDNTYHNNLTFNQ